MASRYRNTTLSLYLLVLWTLLANLAIAHSPEEEQDIRLLEERQNNDNNYQFTGALAIYGNGGGSGQTYVSGGQQTGSPAVQAQCPADHPVSCSNIQEPYYCCPANNYCAWSNSQVSCCPNGASCYSQWQPTHTVYESPPTTVVYGGGGYVAPAATTVFYAGGGYCSTLVANGPGLPTTGQGSCGTILIVAADAVIRQAMGVVKLVGVVIGLQALGGIALLRR